MWVGRTVVFIVITIGVLQIEPKITDQKFLVKTTEAATYHYLLKKLYCVVVFSSNYWHYYLLKLLLKNTDW